MSEYLKDEVPAVYQQLRDLEGEKNRIKYVFRLETEMCVLFEKFYPQQIEKLLRSMDSKRFLLTSSMNIVHAVAGPDMVAVLPQTGWREYPFAIAVSNKLTRPEYDKILRRQGITYETNFARLGLAGFPLGRPDDPNTTVMDIFRDPGRMELLGYKFY